jgi:SAM-dependent methyltransferase
VKRCVLCDTRFVSDAWTCPACGRTPAMSNGVLTFAPELATGNGTDADYRFEALEIAEATHFWFLSRAHLIVWAIRRYFPRTLSILEIGCGTGSVAGAIGSALPDARITAGELLLDGLQRARRRFPHVDFMQMDAKRMPFDAEFDLIGAFDVIEHLDDDSAALREIRAAVRPGGGVLITVPQHPSLWSAFDDSSHHRRRYTRKELASKLHAAGLTVVRMTSFASMVLPLMIISRRLPQRFDPERELRVPPAANRVLSLLSSVERLAIAAGLSLPAGGSLFAAARRSA